ncbi:hypothetical protein N7495_000459 [Penicillium taxi]|uniref:uncharacterized protein n=1 Tax=Penicillium taxi TaxID=168475 RepID=UPI00254565B9|nr:uncharacterized protein N7495_000459 [Penicillium taxi]KAJ5907777.1 hypothetical protein N7495_000459 [Penicillium taxi]
MTTWVAYMNVPPNFVEQNRRKIFPRCSRLFYDKETRRLIMKLAGPAHEIVTTGISKEITDQIVMVNPSLRLEFLPMGASQIHGNSCSKEADWSGQPSDAILPPGRSNK